MNILTKLKNYKVYSDLKVFHYPKFIRHLTTGKNSPLHIRIKPTNRCNHKCYYCSYTNPKQSLGKDMKQTDFIPYEKMMETMDDLINMDVKAVTFSGGGEPTCYPYLQEVLERLSQSKVKFAMLTNGALLSGKVAELFSKYGSWVRISIDGWNRESYKIYRGADDFDKVISNMANFNTTKCDLGLNIVVNKENAEHLYDIVKLTLGYVRNIKISSCVVHDNIEENILYHSKINKTVEEELKRIKENFSTPINYTHHTQICGFSKDYTWCPNIQLQPVIGADQNIYSCHDKAYTQEGLLGSIKELNFKEAWETSMKFQINPAKDCNHHCMAHSKNKVLLDFLSTSHQEFV